MVVSEESGIISVAFNGKLVRGLRDEALEQRLVHVLRGKDIRGKERPSLRRRLSGAKGLVVREVTGGLGVRNTLDEPLPAQKRSPAGKLDS